MNSIQVGNLSIVPNLEKTVMEIHPAIGVVGDTAYVGVWLPCQITDDKGNEKYEDLLFLVTDKRQILLANDNIFREKNLNWQLEYKPIKFPSRWRLKDVQSYLNGADVNPNEVFDKVVDMWKKYIDCQTKRNASFMDFGTLAPTFIICSTVTPTSTWAE